MKNVGTVNQFNFVCHRDRVPDGHNLYAGKIRRLVLKEGNKAVAVFRSGEWNPGPPTGEIMRAVRAICQMLN